MKFGATQVVLAVKNVPVNAAYIRDRDSTPSTGRRLGGGTGNPLQYSYLDYSHGQRSLVATVFRVTKSWKWLKWLSTAHKRNLVHVCNLCLLSGLPRHTSNTTNKSKTMYVMSEKCSSISLLSANFHQIYTDISLNCLPGERSQTLIILVILHKMWLVIEARSDAVKSNIA